MKLHLQAHQHTAHSRRCRPSPAGHAHSQPCPGFGGCHREETSPSLFLELCLNPLPGCFSLN